MRGRVATHLLLWSLTITAACGDQTAPPSCSSALASQIALAVGADTSIDPASDGGCVTFAANASTIDSAEYLVVPQSTGGAPGRSAPFSLLSVTPTPSAPAPVAARTRASPTPVAVAFDQSLRALGRAHAAPARAASARPLAQAAPLPPPQAAPPTVGSLRTFTVCANRLSCGAPANFKRVGARAQAVGAHVAIYVDTLAPANGLNSAELDALKQVFDARLYPLATDTFGAVSDLDANGVVIALMTPVVNALVQRPTCDSSFIAGFFFPPDLDLGAPSFQSNRGEIFYSVVADPTGKFSCPLSSTTVQDQTPAVFVHEFQHMINFAQHVLINHGTATEEGWLDEGLSKYAEELAGRSYLPGDPATFHQYLDQGDLDDAAQYLSGTSKAFLLIPFDNGTLSDVGASWLFVRYLMDQYGGALAGKLDQTTLTGAANITAQTGQGFATLVERWALALWVSDLPGFAAPPTLTYTSWHFRATFDSLYANYPTHFPPYYPLVPVAAGGAQLDISGRLNAGSGAFAQALQGPGAGPFTLILTGPSTAALNAVGSRLTVIRIR